MNWLLEPLAIYVADVSWRDILEILIFSASTYALHLWLYHDRQKPLLGYWYAYCATWMIAYVLHLSTLLYALLIMLPAALVVFVLIHQRTLQKNYITLQSVLPVQIQADDALEVVMQTALSMMNNNKPFLCVIEYKDSLATLLTASLSLQATIKKELLALLLESVTLEAEKYIWLTAHGEIRALNASWITHADNVPTQTARHEWHHDAVFFTSITDALVVYADCRQRTFITVLKGTLIEHATAQNAHRYIKHHKTISNKQGETIHGSYRVNTPTLQQPRS